MSQIRRGYPIGALFVLVTVCAVLVAGVSPLVRALGQPDAEIWRGIAAVGVGALLGQIVGLFLGVIQFRVVLGICLGALAGTLIGAAAGGLSLLPTEQLASSAAAMTVGSGLVVAVALAMRRVQAS
jgi:hypothetical protein